MANVDAAKGFTPIRHLSGGALCSVAYTLTTGATVYKGEVLKMVTGGTVESATADDGVIVVGVAADYVDDSGSAGGKQVQVYDDPSIVFGVQTDSGTAAAATDVGNTANHVAGAGTTVGSDHRKTGTSADELDSSELAGGDGLQCKLIGLVDAPENAWGEHAYVEVIFNEHLYKSSAGTID